MEEVGALIGAVLALIQRNAFNEALSLMDMYPFSDSRFNVLMGYCYFCVGNIDASYLNFLQVGIYTEGAGLVDYLPFNDPELSSSIRHAMGLSAMGAAQCAVPELVKILLDLNAFKDVSKKLRECKFGDACALCTQLTIHKQFQTKLIKQFLMCFAKIKFCDIAKEFNITVNDTIDIIINIIILLPQYRINLVDGEIVSLHAANDTIDETTVEELKLHVLRFMIAEKHALKT